MNPTRSPKRTLALPFLIAIVLALPARSGGPALYVSNEVDNTVAVISPQTNSVVATIVVGRRPRGLAASPDRRTVYVALGQDDALGVIDVASGKMTRTIPAGRDPELVVLSPDGKVAYVSNEEIAHASAIDLATGKILFSTPVGGWPSSRRAPPRASASWTWHGRR